MIFHRSRALTWVFLSSFSIKPNWPICAGFNAGTNRGFSYELGFLSLLCLFSFSLKHSYCTLDFYIEILVFKRVFSCFVFVVVVVSVDFVLCISFSFTLSSVLCMYVVFVSWKQSIQVMFQFVGFQFVITCLDSHFGTHFPEL